MCVLLRMSTCHWLPISPTWPSLHVENAVFSESASPGLLVFALEEKDKKRFQRVVFPDGVLEPFTNMTYALIHSFIHHSSVFSKRVLNTFMFYFRYIDG